MQIALAPMEGLVDHILRDVLTGIGGIDWCVTEFIRVTERVLPASAYRKLAPELFTAAQTRAGTQLRVQLLGSDPQCLADNAAFACTLGAPVIDLNFGCPAKTVNKSRGGAVLLKEPELLHQILREVRRTTPAEIPVTAKMRLGFDDKGAAVECAQALAEGGAQQIVVHARTKVEGYKPPAHWEWVALIKEAVNVPVFANGDVWSVADWQRCREVSGVDDVMIGRGLVSLPDLARQIAMFKAGEPVVAMTWQEFQPQLKDFWLQARKKLSPRFAPGRLKQWLAMLTRNYPEAVLLFNQLRRESDCLRIDAILGVDLPLNAELAS
ncbi:tRNA dihydrouridine synthase [Pseudomonas sp. EL_65y_Pfl2_R95]|uniref:tRNA dihydrouridine synthase n=1 Tax=Pseudomonas sp. EL_65y_Pfl2_R95 TaxID=3088698 RepID=UPI0030DA574A